VVATASTRVAQVHVAVAVKVHDHDHLNVNPPAPRLVTFLQWAVLKGSYGNK
jgi:hypothetical protein